MKDVIEELILDFAGDYVYLAKHLNSNPFTVTCLNSSVHLRSQISGHRFNYKLIISAHNVQDRNLICIITTRQNNCILGEINLFSIN